MTEIGAQARRLWTGAATPVIFARSAPAQLSVHAALSAYMERERIDAMPRFAQLTLRLMDRVEAEVGEALERVAMRPCAAAGCDGFWLGEPVPWTCRTCGGSACCSEACRDRHWAEGHCYSCPEVVRRHALADVHTDIYAPD